MARIARENLGAWVVKANPALWDVHAARAANEPLTRWRLTDSYRLDLVRPGDVVLVWATRSRSNPAGRPLSDGRARDVGFLAEAVVAGPLGIDVGGSHWARATDRERVRPFVPLARTSWWGSAVTIDECRADPVLSGIEVLRAPRIGNPSHLNREQLAALERLREAG